MALMSNPPDTTATDTTPEPKDWAFLHDALKRFQERKAEITTTPVSAYNLEELRILKHIVCDLQELIALRTERLPCAHGRPNWEMCRHCLGTS